MPKGIGDNLKAVVEYAKLLNDLRKKEVVVGLPKGKADYVYPAKDNSKSPPLSVIDIGLIHELGSPEAGIPARPFLKPMLQEKHADVMRVMNSLVKIESHKTADEVLGKTGAYAAGLVIRYIKSGGEGKWAPLKESTIKAKESSSPLIDGGHLWQSITYEVRNAT